MRLRFSLLTLVLLLPILLLGCHGGGQGQSPHTQIMSIAYKPQGVLHKVKEGLRDTTDALNITPRVKGAILADAQLNNKRNHINVGTRDYVVHLNGHVYSEALKGRAGRVAAHKLYKMHKNYKVSNELSIVR